MFSQRLSDLRTESLTEPSILLALFRSAPIVMVIKLTTALAAAVTANAPSCAAAGGGAISPNAIRMARRTAMVDFPRPAKHDETSFLQNSMPDSPRYRSCAHCFDGAGQFLPQFRNFGQTQREFCRELFITLKERQAAVALQEPGSVHPFPLERRADPVFNRRRHNVDGLRCFRFFAQHEQRLCFSPLARCAEPAYFIKGRLVQMQVGGERLQIALLLPNDFGRNVFDDTRPVRAWLGFRSHEVLQGLADSPDTGSPFPAGSEKLLHLWRQYRRVQERPAFVENRDIGLPASARCPFRHRIRDDHAHRAFEFWVGGQALDRKSTRLNSSHLGI